VGMKIALAGFVTLALLVITAIPAYAQQDITVSIGNASLAPQASTTIPIMITSETAKNVCSARINLTFDPSVVQVTSVEGNEFFDIFNSSIIDGSVSMTGMNWTFLTTPIKFVDVTVKAVGNPGDYSPLNLTINELRDEDGAEIYPREVSNGLVSIIAPAPVPEYNIYGLSALIGLLAIIMVISIRSKFKIR